jgi:hypothetical protein
VFPLASIPDQGAFMQDNPYDHPVRTVGFLISAVLLLFFGGSGLQSFLKDWVLVETSWQRVANIGQLLLAVTGLCAGIGAVAKRPWTGKAALAFAGAVAFTAWAKPVAWAESGVVQGLLDAGLGFLLAYLLYLGVRGAGRAGKVEGSGPPSSEG